MLVKNKKQKSDASQFEFVIVASLYNAKYVNAMVQAAEIELKKAGARRIRVIRVPGAFEIPVAAARLARMNSGSKPGHLKNILGGIICLGLILRGETVHAAHIGDAVTHSLMELQITHEIPVIHEVLLLENEKQAEVRCLGKDHNRGTEAAQTAIAMAQVMAQLSASQRKD
jgi:6,7-dimethyl-8-ribityllumazine synthase